MNKNWKSFFLTEDKLCICYLLQNFSQFKSFKEIGKALARNLKRFFGGNSTNSSQIIIFDKATNLFTLGTLALDIGYYVVLNYILSCLKELFIQFFMLSKKSRVEKLLPSNILVKEYKKDNKNRWNNLSSHMPLLSTYD